jgi:magnesium transporter
MIRAFVAANGRLQAVEDLSKDLEKVVWVDLASPTKEEEAVLESQVAIDIPTREEMAEIEISSRLYYDEGAAFMTAIVPAMTETDNFLMAPVTFVLTSERPGERFSGPLVTVRYHEPRAFQTFPQRAEKVNVGCTNGEAVLVALLEAIIDRLADVLERAQGQIDTISKNIFQRQDLKPAKSADLQKLLQEIGRKGDMTSSVRDSLFTLQRVIGFLAQVTTQRKSDREIRARVKTLSRDAHSLTDHSSSMSQKVTFLLDATLGMINIEQNAIIKIFSVAAVVFLPPTLIASIYGMNFDYMPELGWPFGYPLAGGLMVLSAVLPYLFFKRRGWL